MSTETLPDIQLTLPRDVHRQPVAYMDGSTAHVSSQERSDPQWK